MSDPKVVSLNPAAKTEAPPKYDVGEVVVLNGGGCVMTVRRATKTAVYCEWHSEAGELQTADFPTAMLHYAELDIDVELEDDSDAVH